MEDMFCCCNNLINLDISSFDTKNVTNMSYMFYDCRKLNNLDLSFFVNKKLDNKEGIKGMFYNCEKILNQNLSIFKQFDKKIMLKNKDW